MPTHAISVNSQVVDPLTGNVTVVSSPELVTYTEVQNLIATSGLIVGRVYKITDRGDRGILLFAVAANKLSREGKRLMLCPAWYGVDVINGNSWKGVWSPVKTAAVNDLMIWGGKVWKNKTGAIGASVDDLSLDATNWQVIPKTSFANGEYKEMELGVSFDIENDWVERQWDSMGNEFGLGYAAHNSEWGDYSINFCDVSDWNYAANSYGEIMFNNKAYGVYNNSCSSIYNNRCLGIISANRNQGRIYNNEINGNTFNNSNAGHISNNKCGPIRDNSNAGAIDINTVDNHIAYNSNGGSIERNSCTYIDFNSNSGYIMQNYNNGCIHAIGAANTNIKYNTNNGDITTTTTGAITDTVVNK